MKRVIGKWTINQLMERYKPLLSFPEFQREPNVWDLYKKQKLIDSIFRRFDIAPIYIYQNVDDTYECIDGRQRINAIYSFLGKNENTEGSNNGFAIKVDNDIFTDTDEELLSLNGKTYEELSKEQQEKFMSYELNVVFLQSEDEDIKTNQEELSHQFIRLQFSSVLNSGEKLHAMSGDMRDYIFTELCNDEEEGKKPHAFFRLIKIPYKRFARQQVAAQLVLNYFSRYSDTKTFSRSRYIDLQIFFKKKAEFKDEDRVKTSKIREILDIIVDHLGDGLSFIENRAIAISTFLFCAELVNTDRNEDISNFGTFLTELIATIKWQLKLYRDTMEPNSEYREIFSDFNNYVNQAAGESYAIERRHNFLCKYFDAYLKTGEIIGDSEYEASHGVKAATQRNGILATQKKLLEE